MDNEQEDFVPIDGVTELSATWELYANLLSIKAKNNGTSNGRLWAIAATKCEELFAWISYVVATANDTE